MFRAQGDLNKDGSDVDSEEENEEGDYTVFECPGLAPVSDSCCLGIQNEYWRLFEIDVNMVL